MATIADGLHGDMVHAALHATQLASNIATAVPPFLPILEACKRTDTIIGSMTQSVKPEEILFFNV
ncbi:hypothetical protein [Endozoicomonas ascidiicola]|uniref:hypothetical protein n=1 Tax=Endozoicomonas ascidiicola TaxID=1698521 RepID=UPI0012FD9885|nr:hypothetical protein [Endozoicomonas ascidiicola]